MEKAVTTTSQTLDLIRDKVITFLTEYGFQIVGALIIITCGAIIAWWLGRVLNEWLEKKRIEPPICMLVTRVVRLLAFGLATVLALEKAGVPIAPMIAGIGVAGVGVGLAMQGVLSNVVAGLNIIFTKPFRVGEYIEIAEVSGQVQSIELFATTLLHTDQSRVVVPNRKVVGEILHNYGSIRQLDLTVGVAYGTNIEQALAILGDLLKANPRVLKDPTPLLGIAALADSSVTLFVKPWVRVADYNPVSAELYQAILQQFRANRIEIPFPQREVRLLKEA
jgi:small conductance mechanosensitive channel